MVHFTDHTQGTEEATHWWCIRCRSHGLLHLGALEVCGCGGDVEFIPALEVEIRLAEPLAMALTRVIGGRQPVAVEGRTAYPLREAAIRIGVGATKMKELIRDGEVKTVLIGRRRHIPASELDRLATPPSTTAPLNTSGRRRRPPPHRQPDGAAIRAAILRGGR